MTSDPPEGTDDPLPDAEGAEQIRALERVVETETGRLSGQIARVSETWESEGIGAEGIGRWAAAQNLATSHTLHTAARAMLLNEDGSSLTPRQLKSDRVRKRVKDAKDLAKAASELAKTAHEMEAYADLARRRAEADGLVPEAEVESVDDAEGELSALEKLKARRGG